MSTTASKPVNIVPFVDPQTGQDLRLDGDELRAPNGATYPILRGIPRFVPSEGYAASFGLEWTVHAKTQLDSRSGTTISRDRLVKSLGHPLSRLKNKVVLEPGCGAGRFTEHLLAAGAYVHAFDLSASVDAVRDNVGPDTDLVLAQADILKPPFPPDSFEVILCLGVLQYTPEAVDTLASLWRMLKPGGRLIVDQYRKELRRYLKLDPVVRLLMTRLHPETARRVNDRMVRLLFPLHWAVRGNTLLRALLTRVSPVYVYATSYPNLSKEQHFEWATLDTYNHLTGRFQIATTVPELRKRLVDLGATDVDVFVGGNGVVGRATKPAGS